MTIDDFVKLVADQFDDTPIDKFAPDTEFKKLDEWNSLIALSIISAIDDDLDKQITGADLRSVQTIKQLFDLVEKK